MKPKVIKNSREKSGIFKGGLGVLKPNYFYERIRSNKELRNDLRGSFSISEVDKKNKKRRFFLIEPLDESAKSIKIGSRRYKIKSHIALYKECQFSENPKVESRSTQAGHIHFAPGHVTLDIALDEKKSESDGHSDELDQKLGDLKIRYYFKYQGYDINHRENYFFLENNKSFKPDGQLLKSTQEYINAFFAQTIIKLQLQVSHQHTQFNTLYANLENYCTTLRDQNSLILTEKEIKEYLCKVDACIKQGQFMVEELHFHSYKPKLEWFGLLKKYFLEKELNEMAQNNNNNNNDKKSKKHTKKRKKKRSPESRDIANPEKKQVKRKTVDDIDYIVKIHEKLQSDRQAFRDALFSKCKIEEIEKVYRNTDQSYFLDSKFIVDLFITYIDLLREDRVQYLIEKVIKFEVPFLIETEMRIMQKAFRMAEQFNERAKAIEIFSHLWKSRIFFRGTLFPWSYLCPNGKVIENISLINLSLLRAPHLLSLITQEWVFMSPFKFKLDRRGEVVFSSVEQPNNAPYVVFVAKHFLVEELILIDQFVYWSENPEQLTVFGLFVFREIIKQLSQAYEASKMEKARQFTRYLLDKNFDFFFSEKNPELDYYVKSSGLFHFPSDHFVRQWVENSHPEIVELILQKTPLPYRSYSIYLNKPNDDKLKNILVKNVLNEDSLKNIKQVSILEINSLTMAIQAYCPFRAGESKEQTERRQKIVHLFIKNLSKLTSVDDKDNVDNMISSAFHFLSEMKKAVCLLEDRIKDIINPRYMEIGMALEKASCVIDHKRGKKSEDLKDPSLLESVEYYKKCNTKDKDKKNYFRKICRYRLVEAAYKKALNFHTSRVFNFLDRNFFSQYKTYQFNSILYMYNAMVLAFQYFPSSLSELKSYDETCNSMIKYINEVLDDLKEYLQGENDEWVTNLRGIQENFEVLWKYVKEKRRSELSKFVKLVKEKRKSEPSNLERQKKPIIKKETKALLHDEYKISEQEETKSEGLTHKEKIIKSMKINKKNNTIPKLCVEQNEVNCAIVQPEKSLCLQNQEDALKVEKMSSVVSNLKAREITILTSPSVKVPIK